MRVRPFTLEDREFIVGLSARFAESRLPPWRPADMIVDGTARQLETALATRGPRSEILVAEADDGTRLGFAWVLLLADFFTGGDYCKISEIATARDGTGAGAALMNACEVWAQDRGCTLIMLNVLRDNAHARAFYEAAGYEPEYTAMTKVIGQAGD
ncbi:MAG TPA: GNAT family N-acetyltransferase [Candidatus Acidoferrales bacterium]|jgi:GNAT superfamily N-acetyltransferase|nr:GNAT family N-acetyltransferase [Candidatus Acidoferrales bacterium]